ncbi:MAG TPA: GAF and ANTAR domain-containing protein [Propionibacteriaceae bacterium]|nr:GAF and ANTAR domain-containing protein [Propionibacteriaceae bacterium]
MSALSVERFAAVIAEVADTLVDQFDLIDFLHTVTGHAADLLDAAAVGLMLADLQGELHFVAASQEAAEMLELFQIQNREGPCLDAFTTGTAVVSADLGRAHDRWPQFAPRAVAAGFGTVHAFPLRLRADVIGALNVFSASQRILAPAELAVVQALADVATIGLLQERAIQRGALLAEQLQKALTSRVIIEQAKGAIAQAQGVGVDEAFTLLRAHARRNHLSITDLARTCVTEPASVPELMRRLQP